MRNKVQKKYVSAFSNERNASNILAVVITSTLLIRILKKIGLNVLLKVTWLGNSIGKELWECKGAKQLNTPRVTGEGFMREEVVGTWQTWLGWHSGNVSCEMSALDTCGHVCDSKPCSEKNEESGMLGSQGFKGKL